MTKLKICYCENSAEALEPVESKNKTSSLLHFLDVYYSGIDLSVPARSRYQKAKINEQFKSLGQEESVNYLSKRSNLDLYGDEYKDKFQNLSKISQLRDENAGYDQNGYYRSSKRGHFSDGEFPDGKGRDRKEGEDFLVCKNCKTETSLAYIDPPLIKEFVMRFEYWLCPDCKICGLCNKNSVEQKMLFCDLCDRGFDLDCLGLTDVPEDDWYCKDCSYCNMCTKPLLDGQGRDNLNELKNNIWGYHLLCKSCHTKKSVRLEKMKLRG